MIVNLIAPRVVLSVVLSFIPAGLAVVPVLVFSGVLLIWQVVGGWRHAGRIMRETGDLATSITLYFGIGLAIILAAMQLVDRISEVYLVPVDLTNFQAKMLEIRQEGRIIVIDGPLSYRENTALKATLKAFPNAQTVELDSNGGSVFAARALAFTIAVNGLATQVNGACFSACTLAFMAGEPRILGPNGQLGFHGYAFDNAMRVQTVDVGKQQDKDRVFFATRGLSTQFINRIFATPPSELWRPDRDELIGGGVIAD